ncbi:MAG: hydroxymethylbilane synthase [Deltaproteobacteria bacterium]|nr:hydroxymethylbilane synthase [Deltaproteobacteria bacterium]
MLTIGTRGSDLALMQTGWVAGQLRRLGVDTRIEIIRTRGDDVQHLSFDKIEGKGFFTKEIEDALLNAKVDLAVHSLKDLPTDSPPGLAIAALPQREDPRDCLLIRRESYDQAGEKLPLLEGASIGTSAVRRKAQVAFLRPDLCSIDLRGNVPTRVERLREGRYDAILLAQAGLTRLGLDLRDFVAAPLSPELFIPAPAQGVLGLQVRAEDHVTRSAVARLDRPEIVRTVSAERELLALLDGGCHLPLGAYATSKVEGIRLLVFFRSSEDPSEARRLELCGADPIELAQRAQQELVGG